MANETILTEMLDNQSRGLKEVIQLISAQNVPATVSGTPVRPQREAASRPMMRESPAVAGPISP